MKTLTPTHEIWIEVKASTGTLVGEALIGLVYRDETGRRHEVLAAIPMHQDEGQEIAQK